MIDLLPGRPPPRSSPTPPSLAPPIDYGLSIHLFDCLTVKSNAAADFGFDDRQGREPTDCN